MFGRRFKRFRTSVAIGLLFSLSPMLFLPFLGSSNHNGAERHAEWLRGQIKGDVNDTVERAITHALESDSHNLQLFLEAFVEAYLEENGSGEESLHIDRVLFEIFHRHWTQLIVEGVVPYLSLKTLQVRMTYARDRDSSVQLFLQKCEINRRFAVSWIENATVPTSLLVSTLISLSIVPRGP